jgi:adenine-specific DNA-methyltransferase
MRHNLVFEWKGYSPPTNGWRYDRSAMERLDGEGLLLYPKSKEQRIQYKRYLHNTETWAPASVFYKDRRAASKSLLGIMESDVFDFPKDVDVIARWINVVTVPGDVVLDFFAGSGTTGHSVMTLNREAAASRRFILVQLPEPLDLESKEQKAAALYCQSLGKPLNIAELTKERLRRSAKIVRDGNPMFSGDLGFRVFKLDKSNIREWSPDADDLAQSLLEHHEHILEGRTEADIVYELLLKLGLDLCVPMESRTVAGKSVGAVGGGVLMLCLAENISAKEVETVAAGIVSWHKELAPAGDSTVVFRDSAFADDVAKTNMAAILAQNGLENVRSL